MALREISDVIRKDEPELVDQAEVDWDMFADTMGRFGVFLTSKREAFIAGFAAGALWAAADLLKARKKR